MLSDAWPAEVQRDIAAVRSSVESVQVAVEAVQVAVEAVRAVTAARPTGQVFLMCSTGTTGGQTYYVPVQQISSLRGFSGYVEVRRGPGLAVYYLPSQTIQSVINALLAEGVHFEFWQAVDGEPDPPAPWWVPWRRRKVVTLLGGGTWS